MTIAARVSGDVGGLGQVGCCVWGIGIWLFDFDGTCLWGWGSALGFARGFGLGMHVGFGVFSGWGLVTLKRSCCID